MSRITLITKLQVIGNEGKIITDCAGVGLLTLTIKQKASGGWGDRGIGVGWVVKGGISWLIGFGWRLGAWRG